MPVNPTTDKAYRGGNAIHLMATGLRKGYEDPRWMTYKQAADQGWQVRKGEKGTQIEFWEVKPYLRQREEQDRPDGGTDTTDENRSRDGGTRLIHRVYTVFNAKQMDGVPVYKPKEFTVFEAAQAGEQILSNSGARISHNQADRAFYHRASDSIHLPPKDAFKDAAGYYGTALHELAHWSGHPTRLNRATLNESYRFGDANYAKEELRAELASVFLAAERGIPHDPEQHAAYVGSWIKTLKEDKNEIFRAAHDASAATDFLLALERDRSVADQALGAGPAMDSAAGSSRAAVLEEETGRLERDRENETELSSQVEAQREEDRENTSSNNAPQESTRYAARFERGSGTVAVEHKENGDAHRTPVEQPAARAKTATDSSTKDQQELSPLRGIVSATLGQKAALAGAFTDSGSYGGLILGVTDRAVVQQQSRQLGIIHYKDQLPQALEVGKSYRINYSNGIAHVRESKQRSKGQELSR
jgi:antirestriction protein ArdC